MATMNLMCRGAMATMKCPKCASEHKQHKIGKLPSGSQRYQCYLCGCKYTPEKKPRGYPQEIRQKALQLVLEGMSYRAVARYLGVSPQSVANWVHEAARSLPAASVMRIIVVSYTSGRIRVILRT